MKFEQKISIPYTVIASQLADHPDELIKVLTLFAERLSTSSGGMLSLSRGLKKCVAGVQEELDRERKEAFGRAIGDVLDGVSEERSEIASGIV